MYKQSWLIKIENSTDHSLMFIPGAIGMMSEGFIIIRDVFNHQGDIRF